MRTILLVCLVALIGIPSQAQMEIPAPSPKAKVMQTVGVTDITIEYSSPGVKDREIFGGLVPYDEMWRTGANKATAITFSKPVTINGKEVDAGSYSLFTIPGKKEWTIILNKNTELWGTGGYEESEDAVRIKAMPKKADFRERMAFEILDFDNDGATIALIWEKTRVDFVVEVNTMEQAMASIESTLNPHWRTYASAARFAWEQAGNTDLAMEWVNASIKTEETWYNHWLKGEILAEQGDYSGAFKYMEKALTMGSQEGENFFYKDRVEKNIANWKGKM